MSGGSNSDGAGVVEDSEGSNHDGEGRIVAYRDFSREPPGKITQTKESAQTFPMKLHSILSNPEFDDVIAFLPHGRAWRILQHKAFEERVIPLYFRHGRYSSFARQVNGWGFRRITHGPDYNSYYHELFLRGLPHLCLKMRRLTSADIKKAQQEEAPLPDFYALSRDYPLPNAAPLPTKPVASQKHEKGDTRIRGRWQEPTPSQMLQVAQGGTSNVGAIARSAIPPSMGAAAPSDSSINSSITNGMTNGFNAALGAGENIENLLERRRSEILQSLIGLTSNPGGAPSAAQQQLPQAPPPQPPAPFQMPSGINAGLLALLQQHGLPPFAMTALAGRRAGQTSGPPAAAPSAQPSSALSDSAINLSRQLTDLYTARSPASNPALPSPAPQQAFDFVSLLRQQQQQQSPPAPPPTAPAPQQSVALGAFGNLDLSQLLSNPNAAAILQSQLQQHLSNVRAQAPVPDAASSTPSFASQQSASQAPNNVSFLQVLGALGMPTQASVPPAATTASTWSMPSNPMTSAVASAAQRQDTQTNLQRQLLEAQLSAVASGNSQLAAMLGLSFGSSFGQNSSN